MAERIIANLTLDTYQRNKIPPLVIPQHDYGARYIRVRITEQGENVSAASGSVVSIIAKRMADGQSAAFSGSVNADGSVLVPVTQWMLDAPSDDVDCHVAVTGTGYQYSTTSFVISPQERENPSYLEEDDPRVNIVEEALIKVVEEADRAEEQADLAQSAASTAASDAKEAARQEVEQLVGQLGIVQTLGNSRLAVVSQAVTTGLYNRNAKRIANLEHGFNEQFETDSSVAYVKDVPENALPYAEVKKVGGMTYKDGDTLHSAKVTEVESVGVNLIPYPHYDTTKTTSGITFTDNGDGTTTANGTATADVNYWLMYEAQMPAGSYVLSGAPSVTDYGVRIVAHYVNADGTTFYLNVYGGDEGKVLSIPPNTALYLYIGISSGTTLTNVVFKPMLNIGSTAEPYSPYVRNTLPIPVEVRGSENLIPETSVVIGKYWEINANGTVFQENLAGYMCASEPLLVKPNNTYFVSTVPSAETVSWAVWFVDENYKALGRTEGWQSSGGTFTVPSNCRYALFTARYNRESYQNNIMINEGPIALPYEPYSAVKGLDGYGLGISDTVYNYIDWEKKQFVKRCAMVDLGTLEWTLGSVFYASIRGKKGDYNLLSAPYPVYVGGVNSMPDKSLTINTEYGDLLYIKDTSYTDAATFKAAMSGVMLVYELETPEVTDISGLISADNFIGVEGGGTLTFKNVYEYAVPSEVEYQVEV